MRLNIVFTAALLALSTLAVAAGTGMGARGKHASAGQLACRMPNPQKAGNMADNTTQRPTHQERRCRY